MEKDKKYGIFQNLSYCIHAAGEAYPRLILFCGLIIFINCAVPVITTFLPKVVIEEITGQTGLARLLAITAIMTGALAILAGLQKYLDRLIYWHKFKVNAFFLRKVTKKGLTTDYKNQEALRVVTETSRTSFRFLMRRFCSFQMCWDLWRFLEYWRR